MPYDMEMEEYEEELREKELNMHYQGKTKEQIQYSEIVSGVSVLLMIGIILLSWIWKLL